MEWGVTIAIIVAIVFIGLIFWVNSKRRKVSAADQRNFKKHWEEIVKESKTNPKGAILEADKLLDKALKIKGYQGSLGEKLKSGGSLFTNLNHVWEAHKLRNRIAHELNIHLSPHETETALRRFKQALKDLGIQL